MPLPLPKSTFGFLPRSPLELVVCQVRHEERPINPKVALAIQEALGGSDGEFGRIEQVEMHTATVNVGGGGFPGPPDVAQGWHLKTADGAWTVALLPGHVSLETTKYTQWKDFFPRLEVVVRAVEAVAAPTMEQRLGLRYVDGLHGLGVTSPSGWAKWIQPSLLGPCLHEVIGGAVQSTRQQVDLDLGEHRSCVLRHGTVPDPDGALAYLLDFDVYRQQARAFSSEAILSSIESFHQAADALFQQVITEDLLAYLAGDQNV